MALLVLATSRFVQQQLDVLRALAPHETVYTDPERAPPDDIEAILAFKLQDGIAGRFPRLRFIAAAGAGADEILAAGDLPDVPIVRPVDPLHAKRIAQYVALMTLRLHRELARLEAQHGEARWERFAPRDERVTRVGILGYGASGRSTAEALLALGYEVGAWHRTAGEARDGDVHLHHGAAGLRTLLEASDVLVCALPLTSDTRGLVGHEALRALRPGAYLIDVSRGGVIDHGALVELVESGHLAGAALDVFPQEPLPEHSALWRHPRILCTPHIAGTPRPEIAVAQFLDNLQRARRGESLQHRIDPARGY
jgi:phosphoglycerate dehydrogenase-like enzyme